MGKTRRTIQFKQKIIPGNGRKNKTVFVVWKTVNTVDYEIGDVMNKTEVDSLIRRGYQVTITD